MRHSRRVFTVLTHLAVMARLMCDVNMAEEAELWRQEHGSSPRSPGLRIASWPPTPWSMEAVEGAVVLESMQQAPSRMPVASAVLAAAQAGVLAPKVPVPPMPAVVLEKVSRP